VSNVFVQDAIQAKNDINQDRKVLTDIEDDIELTKILQNSLTVYRIRLMNIMKQIVILTHIIIK
jgi:hypothetical protein